MKFETVHFVDMGLVGAAKDKQQVLVMRIAQRDRQAAIVGLCKGEDLSRRGLVQRIGCAIIKAQRERSGGKEPISRLEEGRLIDFVRAKYA